MAEILLKRGTAATIPTLAVGEPGFTTDTHQCYVGSGAGNILIGPGGGVPTTRLVATQYSLSGGGDLSADRTHQLVNDASAPGTSMAYATDASGTRGWQSVATWNPAQCNFRLSLTSGDPCPAADVTGGTTLYAALNGGNKIALWDGSKWVLRSSAEFSLSLASVTANVVYDVFCYDNAGTATLELTAWTNPTTRATAIAYQDGVPCKSGALTRRYLGTFYGLSGSTTDSAVRRFLWNVNDRRRRKIARSDPTSSWTDSTVGWRQANLNGANLIEVMVGLAQSLLDLRVSCTGTVAGGAINVRTSMSEDTATTPAHDAMNPLDATVNGYSVFSQALLIKVPTVGYHYYNWLEYMGASGTVTFIGGAYSGMNGVWEC